MSLENERMTALFGGMENPFAGSGNGLFGFNLEPTNEEEHEETIEKEMPVVEKKLVAKPAILVVEQDDEEEYPAGDVDAAFEAFDRAEDEEDYYEDVGNVFGIW